mgnify:CR=1 FL=1
MLAVSNHKTFNRNPQNCKVEIRDGMGTWIQQVRVLGQLWHLPTSMTILIDLTLGVAKNGSGKSDVVVETSIKMIVSMDHFACDASVFW